MSSQCVRLPLTSAGHIGARFSSRRIGCAVTSRSCIARRAYNRPLLNSRCRLPAQPLTPDCSSGRRAIVASTTGPATPRQSENGNKGRSSAVSEAPGSTLQLIANSCPAHAISRVSVTIEPVSVAVNVPDSNVSGAVRRISSRRSGASVVRPPMRIPRLPKLVKPHST